MNKRKCTIEGCFSEHRAKGFCSSHYRTVWIKENEDRRQIYKARERERMKKMPEHYFNLSKASRERRKDTIRKAKAEYYQKNKARIKAKHAVNRQLRKLKDPYYQEKRQREKLRRKSMLTQATPPWVDRQALKDFYKNRPEGMEVDHIVPLAGKDVSGLHVPWNLQYLTHQQNMEKSNKCPQSELMTAFLRLQTELEALFLNKKSS